TRRYVPAPRESCHQLLAETQLEYSLAQRERVGERENGW
ncbi:MAG: hypothetical protein RLZZ350_716, partial [Verrucomicrobiota bacterium]